MKTNINILNLNELIFDLCGIGDVCITDVNKLNLFNDLTIFGLFSIYTVWELDLKYYPKSLLEKNFEHLSEFEYCEEEEEDEE